jgi:bifunctional UDP-N-acetylglucosamine pyrophosphorylase/glucosamine-1-phosphate N-acetyltransferase
VAICLAISNERNRHIVILAAGKGTRMKTRRPKVLHSLCGAPILHHVLRTAQALHPDTTCLVVGHQADELRGCLPDADAVTVVLQEPQLGTGHALLQTEPALGKRRGTVVLLSGDVPLLKPATVEALIAHHESTGAVVTVLTTMLPHPFGYGRIVRHEGRLVRIVEERDASPEQRRIQEVNSGVYAFDLAPLFDALRSIATENSQGEYYLPDLIGIYRRRGLGVETVFVSDPAEVRGINSQRELAELAAVSRDAKNEELMSAGVTLIDPATTYVDVDVEVGPDTIVHPNVHLEGRTRIGSACEIQAGARIVDSTIGDGATVRNYCVIQGASIAARAVIGPFAHIRPESSIGEGAHVGNFVELKKTTLGPGTKANHLSYLGDATIGARVNVGAGTITCNYDGDRKHPTVIEDDVFVGTDTQLIAPVRVGAGAYVAAGTSVVEDVPPGSLAISRSRQVNKQGWVEKRRLKKQTPE